MAKSKKNEIYEITEWRLGIEEDGDTNIDFEYGNNKVHNLSFDSPEKGAMVAAAMIEARHRLFSPTKRKVYCHFR